MLAFHAAMNVGSTDTDMCNDVDAIAMYFILCI